MKSQKNSQINFFTSSRPGISLSSLVAWALCFVVHTSLAHTQKLTTPAIAYQSRTVLIGANGHIAGKAALIDMGPGKMGWVKSWGNKNDSITWQVKVERAGDYAVSSILESSGRNCSIALT